MGGIPRELVLGLVTFSVLAGDVGLSALSVLSNTKLSGAVNMLQGRNMSSRGALTGLRGELVHFSYISRRPSARSCSWVRVIPSTSTGLVKKESGAALRRKMY